MSDLAQATRAIPASKAITIKAQGPYSPVPPSSAPMREMRLLRTLDRHLAEHLAFPSR